MYFFDHERYISPWDNNVEPSLKGAMPDLAKREKPGEGPLFEADFISQGHHLLYSRDICMFHV